jgi:hypothetical protein
MKGAILICLFVLFGLCGSLLIDVDHFNLFIDHPALLKGITLEKYNEYANTYDIHRSFHITLLIITGIMLTWQIGLYITQDNPGSIKQSEEVKKYG